MASFASRRDQLLAKACTEELDAALITSPINVTYLTGFTGEASYLVLSSEKTLLISDGRFVEQIAEECPGLETYIRPPAQSLYEAAGQVLGKLGLTKVGYESSHLTVADFEAIRDRAGPIDWKAGTNRVETLRMIKDAGELRQIHEAIAIAETAFARFQDGLRPDATEKELHDAMEFHVRRGGGRCTSFPTIVAVGARAALPHAPPTGRRIGESPFVLVDWGAAGPLYKSDLTRVIWTHKSTEPPGGQSALRTKLLQVADVVRQAQLAAMAQMRPGVEVHVVDSAARDVIRSAGFGDFFNHGLGHGIGLQIHEAPFMRPGNKTVLQAGMVVTVEPGIYLPGELGVRIEDDVLITDQGVEVLTHVPREI